MMIIGLVTSRVVLNALGVNDFGIYQVVGGLVAMFSILSGSLTAAISRFITFELGAGDFQRLKRVFSTSVTIQIIFSIIILFVAETIGLWFLNYKIVVPENRIAAANWCYQLSILTFVIGLISVPYNAAIIAHERMSAFAYIGIFESISKLIIAYLLMISPVDKLCFYASLTAILSIIVRLIYGRYCGRHFEECHYKWSVDKELLKSMFGFAGWNSIGAISWVLREQGGTILINLFFGPSANAAKAIGSKVSTVVSAFSTNFMTALNPQITKSYACNDKEYMFKLAFKGIRFSFYLLFLISLPVLINTQYVLYLWLKLVPENAAIFVQLSIMLVMTEVLSGPLIVIMLATGDIKRYQIIVGGLQMLNFPVSYALLSRGAAAEIVLVVAVMLSLACLIARLILLRKMVGLDPSQYVKEVLSRIIVVSIASIPIPYYLNSMLDKSLFNFLFVSVVSIVIVGVVSFLIGCTNKEKIVIIRKVNQIISLGND